MAERPLEQTTKLFLFIDGIKIGRLQNLELSNESGKIRVDDIEQGFSGFSVGAGATTITGSCYVPLGGQADFDFTSAASQSGGIHEAQFPVGALTYIGEGYFQSAKVAGSINDTTKVDFTFIGQSNALE